MRTSLTFDPEWSKMQSKPTILRSPGAVLGLPGSFLGLQGCSGPPGAVLDLLALFWASWGCSGSPGAAFESPGLVLGRPELFLDLMGLLWASWSCSGRPGPVLGPLRPAGAVLGLLGCQFGIIFDHSGLKLPTWSKLIDLVSF